MDVRRVQITGGSSFMITLPKEWAVSVGLNKNDSVGLQVQPDGSLALYPKGVAPESKHTTKVIDATNITDRGFLYRQLVGAYIAGHSSILITSDKQISSAIASAVANFVQTSIGLETIEADDTHILVSDLIEHDAVDPKKTIDRMRILTKSMLYDMYDAAYTGNLDDIKEMKSRDISVDRIYWLTSRQCNIYQKDTAASHKMNLTLYELTSCLSVSRVLENIADYSIVTSNYIIMIAESGNIYRMDEEIHKISQRVIDLLSSSVKSWIDRDIVAAEKSIKEADSIIIDADKISKSNMKTNNVSSSVEEVILFISKRISEYCKDIAEYSFNMSME